MRAPCRGHAEAHGEAQAETQVETQAETQAGARQEGLEKRRCTNGHVRERALRHFLMTVLGWEDRQALHLCVRRALSV
jgi:hypothetical protein